MEPSNPTPVNTSASVLSNKKDQNAKAPKPSVDVALLDLQLAELDSDEFDSEDDSHTGSCSCCAGLVGTIRTQ